MSYNTPCADGSADDWFIGRDGKQYPDDDILTLVAIQAIADEADRQELVGEARVAFIEKAQDRAEGDDRRERLQKRRHARDECHASCYFRTSCLELALKNDHQHGIWGGYYEEEIREIRREISRRKRAKGTND